MSTDVVDDLISLEVYPMREFQGAQGRARRKARRTRDHKVGLVPRSLFYLSLVLLAFLLALPLAPWNSLMGSVLRR